MKISSNQHHKISDIEFAQETSKDFEKPTCESRIMRIEIGELKLSPQLGSWNITTGMLISY